jgi:hypothetical protein
MTLKNFSLQKIRYKKNAEFYADSDTDDKNAKKFLTRKFPTCQKSAENLSLSTSIIVSKSFGPKTISVSIFFIFYLSRFEISVKF